MAFGYGNCLLAASAKGSRSWASSTPSARSWALSIRGSGQPVRQHLDFSQVPAAHALRGVLPGLVVPAPVLLLCVDPISLQQVWFRPDQASDGHGRQVPVASRSTPAHDGLRRERLTR